MTRTTCTSHCVACGRHFAGDKAFDMHRRGDHAAGTRHCVSPHDEPRLTIAAEDGVCRLASETVLDAVAIVGLAASRAPAELARLAALRPTVCGDRHPASHHSDSDRDQVPVPLGLEAA
jgi:hypothetical protein